MNIGDVLALLRPVKTSVTNLVSRALLTLADDSKKFQSLQITVLDGEVHEDVEHMQPYGFTSVPKPGAEGVVLFPGGDRSHGLAICIGDRRYRLCNLQSGEVAVYDLNGSKIVLKANGDIQIAPASGVVSLAGDLNVSGTVTATTDVVGGGKSLKTHTHAAGALLDSLGHPVSGSTAVPT